MHIAMWTCARSRSTLLLRAFQQHTKCLAQDEPLYAPYLSVAGFDHPDRETILAHHETDYDVVIQHMTGNLPPDKDFSFQKHTANNVRQDRDLSWLKQLRSFFLIRSPAEILLSRQAIYQSKKIFRMSEVGLEDLYRLFLQVQELTGKTPIVLDSADLLKNPREVLQKLSQLLGFAFSESMLSWSPGLRKTDPAWARTWYRTLEHSTTFLPYRDKNMTLPAHLEILHAACLPFYNALYAQRIQ